MKILSFFFILKIDITNCKIKNLIIINLFLHVIASKNSAITNISFLKNFNIN